MCKTINLGSMRGTGIQTHYLLDMNRLPLLLDQGFRLIKYTLFTVKVSQF